MRANNYIFKTLVGFSLLLLCVACKDSNNNIRFALPEDDSTDSIVKIQRLDCEIENYINLDSLHRRKYISENKDVLWGFGKFVDNIDTIDNTVLTQWSTWPATVIFMPEIHKTFTDLDKEESSISRLMKTAEMNDIIFPYQRFVAVTWGDRRSIVTMDTLSTVYIALNHYLGSDNKAYEGWPDYRKNMKFRDMIPVDVSEALLSTSFPYSPGNDGNVLCRMIYEGAVAVAKQAMNPDASLSMIFGYTPEIFQQLKDNEGFMWKQLTSKAGNSNAILYSEDAEIISNLFDFRPFSTRISPEAPGRAVRWIGYRIVTEYLKTHSETTLKQLLSPDFYMNSTQVLRESGYNPSV